MVISPAPEFEEFSKIVGPDGVEFLLKGIASFGALLPYTELSGWTITGHLSRPKTSVTSVSWGGVDRRSLQLTLVFRFPIPPKGKRQRVKVMKRPWFVLATRLSRMTAPSGIGRIQRTLDPREKDLCARLANRISRSVRPARGPLSGESLRVISHSLAERTVSAHLSYRLGVQFDVGDVLTAVRELAEQSYENKALAFGLIISRESGPRSAEAIFPRDFLGFKRYRVISDGYRSAYRISRAGHFLDLISLDDGATRTPTGSGYFPEWGKGMVESLQAGELGISLTRQGDILVFDSGSLRFTYRRGRWQYWNHRHVVDILRNRLRVQHVSVSLIPQVVRAIYRSSLDISFRRTGALFVVLRSRRNLRRLVVQGDAINDRRRHMQHREFDRCVAGKAIFELSRPLLSEIAGLDGAVVLSNTGNILAYGCVLKTDGEFEGSEGSRTKAAVSASKYGLAVKVSSDGDITYFEKQQKFLET